MSLKIQRIKIIEFVKPPFPIKHTDTYTHPTPYTEFCFSNPDTAAQQQASLLTFIHLPVPFAGLTLQHRKVTRDDPRLRASTVNSSGPPCSQLLAGLGGLGSSTGPPGALAQAPPALLERHPSLPPLPGKQAELHCLRCFLIFTNKNAYETDSPPHPPARVRTTTLSRLL